MTFWSSILMIRPYSKVKIRRTLFYIQHISSFVNIICKATPSASFPWSIIQLENKHSHSLICDHDVTDHCPNNLTLPCLPVMTNGKQKIYWQHFEIEKISHHMITQHRHCTVLSEVGWQGGEGGIPCVPASWSGAPPSRTSPPAAPPTSRPSPPRPPRHRHPPPASSCERLRGGRGWCRTRAVWSS